ncbi:MAG: TRAP transporter substrate-binding protein [Defluviitaleaceae bacterium]|nr:TRAP transporter substrate-binding protein [Defluviitaleaceae bacterium]MCL2262584.1 TRAP transporter substrate-binding protein [Defluviitaleaceae bacterium]
MKKLLSLFITATMLFALAGCAADSGERPIDTRQNRSDIAAASARTLSEYMARTATAAAPVVVRDGMTFYTRDDGTIVFNVLHMSSEEHTKHHGLLRFKEEVETRSNGELYVNIHANSPGDVTLIDMVNAGTADAAIVTILSAWGGLTEMANFEALPFVFSTYEEAWAAYEGTLGDWVAANVIEPTGSRALAYWTNGLRHFTNNVRPIEVPEDMAGLVMRSPQNATHLAMYEAFGAASMAMPFGQLREALADGQADGQDNPIGQIHTGRLFEVQQYMTLSNHMFSTMPFVVSTDLWYSLSAEHRQILVDSAVIAGRFQGELAVATGHRQLQEIRTFGTEVITVNPIPFLDAVEHIWVDHMERFGNEFATIASRYISDPTALAHRFAD